MYFIATKLLRESGAGPALLVSPLLSLMRNQIAAAERMGVRAARITSDNRDHWNEVEERLQRDEVDILLISPERLGNERFRDEVLARIAERIAFLVIDEAHCISDWGHDFRPHYRLIERIARTLPPNLRLLATTATANNRVMDDLRAVLGPNLQVSRGNLGRPSLMLQTIRLPRQSERLAWLAEQVPALPGHGIVHMLTVRDANQAAEWLQSRGIEVEAHTGQTGECREELEQALLTEYGCIQCAGAEVDAVGRPGGIGTLHRCPGDGCNDDADDARAECSRSHFTRGRAVCQGHGVAESSR